MKLQKILLSTLIFLCCFTFCFAQEIPKAELIDEFGNITCEDIIAREDALFTILNEDPAAIAYIIIYGSKTDPRAIWRTRGVLYGQAEFRRFDETRLVFIRGKDGDEIKTQFWKVAAGAEKPNVEEIKWDFDLSEIRKPFVFNSTGSGDDICPIGLQLKTYSDYLTANPDFRGHIVISTKSKKAFQKEKNELTKKLTDIYEVSPKQLRFFFVDNNADYALHELWLVPPKK